MSRFTINGKTIEIEGENISISKSVKNGKTEIFINGVNILTEEFCNVKEPVFNIEIESVNILECENGNITVKNNVAQISTVNGNVVANDVQKASTVNGNIKANSIIHAKSVNGNIKNI